MSISLIFGMTLVISYNYKRNELLHKEFEAIIQTIQILEKEQNGFHNITAKKLFQQNRKIFPQTGVIENTSIHQSKYSPNSLWVYSLGKYRTINPKTNISSKKGLAICKIVEQKVVCVKIDDIEITYSQADNFQEVIMNNHSAKY